MKNKLPEIIFKNQNSPKSYLDIVKIEELLQRDLDHDIFQNHLVKFFIIFFVQEGEGYHTIDFTDYQYSAGAVLLIRKDQVHKFFKNQYVRGYLLVFTEEFILGHLNRMEALKSMQLFNNSLSFPKIEFGDPEMLANFTVLVKHLEVECQTGDEFSIGITRSLLHVIMTKLYRIKAQAGDFVITKKYTAQFLVFQKLVEEDCFVSRKVHHYAKKLGVSTKTLNNITHEVVNNSAKNFIDERAIMRIKRLLISTNYSIKEIAYEAGFSDPTNFFRYFKKFTGSSPEVFRQTH